MSHSASFLVIALPLRTKRRKKLNLFGYDKNFKIMTFVGFITSLVFGILYAPAFFILGEKYLGLGANIIFFLFLVSYILSTVLIHLAEKRVKNFGTKRMLFATLLMFAVFSFLYLFGFFL